MLLAAKDHLTSLRLCGAWGYGRAGASAVASLPGLVHLAAGDPVMPGAAEAATSWWPALRAASLQRIELHSRPTGPDLAALGVCRELREVLLFLPESWAYQAPGQAVLDLSVFGR